MDQFTQLVDELCRECDLFKEYENLTVPPLSPQPERKEQVPTEIDSKMEEIVKYVNFINKNGWVLKGTQGGDKIYRILSSFSKDEEGMNRTMKRLKKKFPEWEFSLDKGTDYNGCPCCMEETTEIKVLIPEENTPAAIQQWEDDFVESIKEVGRELEREKQYRIRKYTPERQAKVDGLKRKRDLLWADIRKYKEEHNITQKEEMVAWGGTMCKTVTLDEFDSLMLSLACKMPFDNPVYI